MAERAPSAAQIVYESLRADIVSGRFVPGAPISRGGLAQRYDVSPTPVREALLRLEREDLVTVHPQSRTEIARLNVLALHQAHFLRVALEIEVVRRMAGRPNRKALREAAKACEMADFDASDRAFHRALFAAVGMTNLFTAHIASSAQMERYRALVPLGEDAIWRARSFHEDVLTALSAKDKQAAEAAMRAHLADELRHLNQLQEKRPEYF